MRRSHDRNRNSQSRGFNLYIPANALLLSWVVGISFNLPTPFHKGTEERTVLLPGIVQRFNRLGLRTIRVMFGCLLLIYAPAWIIFETKFKADPPVENVFCRFGICATDAVINAEAEEVGGSAVIEVNPWSETRS
jgi:hypothetical protein